MYRMCVCVCVCVCVCMYTLCCVDSVNRAHLTRHSIPTCTKLSLYRQLRAFNFCLIRDVSLVWWHGATVLLLCLQSEMFLVAWCDSPVTLSPVWNVSGGMVWQSCYFVCLQSEMFLVAWFDSPVTLSPVWNVSGGMVGQSFYLFSSLGYFWWHVLTVLLLCLQPAIFLVAWFDSPVTLSPAWNVWWHSLTVLLLCLKPRMFLVVWFDSPVTLSPNWVVSNRNST